MVLKELLAVGTLLWVAKGQRGDGVLQEPGDNHELLNGLKYVRPGGGWTPHPKLRLFGKLAVNGKDEHPMYTWLKALCPQTVDLIGDSNFLMYNPIRVSDVTWNFEKFIVDRAGRPRFRFNPAAWGKNGAFVDRLLADVVAEADVIAPSNADEAPSTPEPKAEHEYHQ